ncbi:MAG: hypothetical protein HC895_04695 [Leptolyngbyaceae cyanobacterium SM1_3_5]|nr:hypothetical protein [Leptolyngbyaceae cyanobacterium SM1_3_5]
MNLPKSSGNFQANLFDVLFSTVLEQPRPIAVWQLLNLQLQLQPALSPAIALLAE